MVRDPSGARVSRRLPLVALVGAALLALVLVAVVTRADEQAEQRRAQRPPEGPALRIAGRAGLMTVAVAARPTSLEMRLIAPDVDGAAAELRTVRLTDPSGVPRVLTARGCGDGCYLAPVVLATGTSALTVETAFAGRQGRIELSIPWPARRADPLLREAVRRTGRLRSVTVRERLTSDTNGRFFTNPTIRLAGSELVSIYGARSAQDVRELPPRGRSRRIAFALPAASLWFELSIGSDGVIVRDRITGPNHLILREIVGG